MKGQTIQRPTEKGADNITANRKRDRQYNGQHKKEHSDKQNHYTEN